MENCSRSPFFGNNRECRARTIVQIDSIYIYVYIHLYIWLPNFDRYTGHRSSHSGGSCSWCSRIHCPDFPNLLSKDDRRFGRFLQFALVV